VTELERARTHLRQCQADLRFWRCNRSDREKREGRELPTGRREKDSENAILAALSWVWDAQERKRAVRLLPADAIEIGAGMKMSVSCIGPLRREMKIIWPDGSKGVIVG
jgi:hypothetical protein